MNRSDEQASITVETYDWGKGGGGGEKVYQFSHPLGSQDLRVYRSKRSHDVDNASAQSQVSLTMAYCFICD